jgi:hypothetical protein
MDRVIVPDRPIPVEDRLEHGRGEREDENDATSLASDLRRKEIDDFAPGLFCARVSRASHYATIASTKTNQQGKKNKLRTEGSNVRNYETGLHLSPLAMSEEETR